MAQINLLGEKIISISDRRRITIPKKFYNNLKFGTQVKCFARGDELVLRPIDTHEEDFSDLITEELSEQGLKGEKLSAVVIERKNEIRESLKSMIVDAKKAAHGQGEFATPEEIFGR